MRDSRDLRIELIHEGLRPNAPNWLCLGFDPPKPSRVDARCHRPSTVTYLLFISHRASATNHDFTTGIGFELFGCHSSRTQNTTNEVELERIETMAVNRRVKELPDDHQLVT
jgi:hypothetical protein